MMLAYVQLCNVYERRGITVYLEYRYQNVSPIVGIGVPPTPPPDASVFPPLDPKRREQHSPVGEGVWEPNSDDMEQSLALRILSASQKMTFLPVLRIRDVFPIPDPTFSHPRSEFFHPGSTSKILSILTQKNGF
jgi:hypothetical protein